MYSTWMYSHWGETNGMKCKSLVFMGIWHCDCKTRRRQRQRRRWRRRWLTFNFSKWISRRMARRARVAYIKLTQRRRKWREKRNANDRIKRIALHWFGEYARRRRPRRRWWCGGCDCTMLKPKIFLFATNTLFSFLLALSSSVCRRRFTNGRAALVLNTPFLQWFCGWHTRSLTRNRKSRTMNLFLFSLVCHS